jgi:uncharacterized protein YcfJ
MKLLVIAVASAVGALASPAFAAYDRYGNYYDSRDEYRNDRGVARVIESNPVYTASDTREECWNPREGRFQDRSEARDPNRIAGTALGAIVGGVIGHQIGDNNAGTVAGALLGGIAGNQIERRQQEQGDLDLSRCRTIASGDGPLQGYDVRYEYNGRQYVTRMSSNPGRYLRLGNDVRDDGTPFDGNVAYTPPQSYSNYSYAQPYYDEPYDSR